MKRKLNLKKKFHQVTNAYLNDFDFVETITYPSDLIDGVLQRSLIPEIPVYRPEDIFSSTKENRILKKSKYSVSLINSRIEKVKETSSFLNEYTESLLLSQGDTIKRLNSELEELELKYYNQSDKVHVNNFSKERDKIGYTRNDIFREDYKTGLSFETKNLMTGFFGSGISLPIKKKEIITIDKCTVIDEKTNVGDTKKKIFEGEDPNNIFRKGKIYRHAILKRSNDTTSRRFKRETFYDEYPQNLIATLTIEVDFESYSNFNYLIIDPVSVIGFSLKEMEVKDGPSIINVRFWTKEIANKYYIFFESLSGSKVKLSFEQKVCSENTDIVVASKKNFYMNEALKGANFLSRVPESYEKETGYIYDLSIKSIEFGKISFKSKGFLQSKPIEVFNFVSSSTSLSYYGFGNNFYIESYLGLVLLDKEGNLEVEDLLPLPDYKTFQKEHLDVINSVGKCKLYPDVQNNICLERLAFEAGNLVISNVFWRHFDIKIGDCFNPEVDPVTGYIVNVMQVGFLVSNDYNIVGWAYKSMGGGIWRVCITKLDYDWNNYTLDSFVEELNSSEIFAYSYDEDFFSVYEDGELLQAGTDYDYTLDNGSKWFSSGIDPEYVFREVDSKKAGYFKVRLKNTKDKSNYEIKYKIDEDQVLSKKKNIYLTNEKIRLKDDLFPNYGYCQNIFVVKSPFGNSEEISVIEKYWNNIYEDEESEIARQSIKKKFGSKLKKGDL